MNTHDELMAKLRDKCRENKLKITPQRQEIYKYICSSKNHPTATEVYNDLKLIFPHISLDTVNRNLLDFVGAGLIAVVEGSGEAKRFDAEKRLHHHFRCISCGKIYDIFSDELDQIKIPSHITSNFQITNKKVYLEGNCKQCNRQNAINPSSTKGVANE